MLVSTSHNTICFLRTTEKDVTPILVYMLEAMVRGMKRYRPAFPGVKMLDNQNWFQRLKHTEFAHILTQESGVDLVMYNFIIISNIVVIQ